MIVALAVGGLLAFAAMAYVVAPLLGASPISPPTVPTPEAARTPSPAAGEDPPSAGPA